MASLGEASLSETERRVLERLVASFQVEFGDRLRAVWLYGSRARGETPHPESDVDLIVVLEGADWTEEKHVFDLVYDTAVSEGANPWFFSAHVYTPERLARRREIHSFFIQDVDRDKIVVVGEP